MKVILHDNQYYILRFDKGEEVFSGLLEFAIKNDITASAFYGIGACSEVELGDFDLDSKSYRKQNIKENLEIASLIGNLSMSNEKPVVHAHGSFSRSDLSVIGGHAFRLVISVTCEIFLTKLEGRLARELNPQLNINLLA